MIFEGPYQTSKSDGTKRGHSVGLSGRPFVLDVPLSSVPRERWWAGEPRMKRRDKLILGVSACADLSQRANIHTSRMSGGDRLKRRVKQ